MIDGRKKRHCMAYHISLLTASKSLAVLHAFETAFFFLQVFV